MENLIPVVIILGVLGFILWKNKDKILSVADRFKKPDPGKPEAPYKVPDPPVPVPPVEVKPAPQADYNGVGDPPSQEAWTRWLATLDPMRRAMYPATWKPLDAIPDRGPAPTDRLVRGYALHFNLDAGATFTIPIEHEAIRLSIVPHAGGIGNTYALWISDADGNVIAGDKDKAMFEVSSFQFPASDQDRWANVKNLGQETPLFIQTN